MSKQTMPDLSQFYGSCTWYKHALLPNFLHTEGIQHLAEAVGGHWFIDVVASHQTNAKVRNEPFQLWAIKLDGDGCIVTMRTDTDEPAIVTQEIEYSDFPEDFECYCEANELGGHTLLLKDEH